MKKLSKDQLKQRDELMDKLTGARNELEAAIAKYNAELHEEWNTITDAVAEYNRILTEHRAESIDSLIGKYNDVIGEAHDFAEGIKDAIQEFIDEHGEQWQEGDKGQAYDNWREQWEQVDLRDVEINEPEELELEEPGGIEEDLDDHANTLGELPEEVEE